MNYLKLNEKILKHSLKNKKRITLSLVVTFLITGGLTGFNEEAIARDLRVRKANTVLNVDNNDSKYAPDISKSANEKKVVDIVNPNDKGLSHNKFIDFSVGDQDSVIFNNNMEKFVESKTGGLVFKNNNLTSHASTILTEVTGTKRSDVNGTIEVAGKRADFILANENGITVNGGGFINTGAVTLATGKPTVNGGDVSFDVTKGDVLVEGNGVGTAGDYFNIIAKTIALKGQVAAFEGQNDADVTLIAGSNRVNLKDGKTPTLDKVLNHDKDKNVKYGIYADKMGSMYGKNIKLISTTEGLGVKHEGLIASKENIHIQSNGDIEVAGINAQNKVKIEGAGDLKTLSGVYDSKGTKYNYSVMGSHGVELAVKGDITLENFLNAGGGEGIKIKANNLRVIGDKTSGGIFSQTGLVIKLKGDMTVDALLQPVRKNGTQSDEILIVERKEDGSIVVIDSKTGKVVPESQYSWEGYGIRGENIEIEANSLTNKAIIKNTRESVGSKINIKLNKDLINENMIYSSGTLTVDAKKLQNKKNAVMKGANVDITADEIENDGELRQNIQYLGESVNRGGKILINVKGGNFTNKGTVSGYNVEIQGEGFNLINTKEGQIIASTEDYPKGLGTIKIKVKDLTNEGLIQSYGKGSRNDITIDVESLSNKLGHIIAQKGKIDITSKKGILNTGEIYADKNVTITAKEGNIDNNGGGSSIKGSTVTIKAENGNLKNTGQILAAEKLLIEVTQLLNGNNISGLGKYLEALYALTSEGYEDVEELIAKFEKELETATGKDKEAIQAKLDYFKKVKEDLGNLNSDLETLSGIGVLSGKTGVEIKTTDKAVNTGVIKSDNDVNLTSGKNIANNGIIEAGNNITLKAKEDILNTQRIYAGNKLDIIGKSFKSTGNQELLNKYAEIMKKYLEKGGEEKLKEVDKKVEEVLEKLKTSKNKEEIEKLNKELDTLRKEKQELAKLKSEISSLRGSAGDDGSVGTGLGTIEAGEVSIKATNGDIDNAGVIVTDKDLKLEATDDISNTGNISVGGSADIKGKNFKNENEISIVEKLTAKVQNAFESKSLKIGKDLELEAREAKFTQKLDVGGKADITLKGNGTEKAGEVTFGDNTSTTASTDKNDINIKEDLTIKGGGLINKLVTAIGGNLKVEENTEGVESEFDNTGTLSVGGNATIKTDGFNNKDTGKIIVGKSLNVKTVGKLENSGELFAGGAETAGREEVKVNIESNGLKNTGKMVFGSDTNINFKEFDFESKNLEVKGDLSINGEGNVNIQENGKLQSSGKTTIKTEGDVKNSGHILNTELDLTGKSVTNETSGKIESTHGFNIKAQNGGNSQITNKGSIQTTGKGSFESNNFENSGTIKAGVDDKREENNKEAGSIYIKADKNFTNSKEIIAKNSITVDGKKETLDNSSNGQFTNKGKIVSGGTLTVDYTKNNVDITIEKTDDNKSGLQSDDKMTIKTAGNITVEDGGKISNQGELDFSADKDIKNKGQIVSNSKITLKGKNIFNGDEDTKKGATIWSFGDLILEAQEKITNRFHSFIKAGFAGRDPANMTITSKELLNEGSTIQATGNININANKIENKAIFNPQDYKLELKDKYKHSWTVQHEIGTEFKADLEFFLPIYNNNTSIKAEDKAYIQAGNSIDIKGLNGQTNVENTAGTIQAGTGKIDIDGKLSNKSFKTELTIEEYFNTATVRYWRHGTSGDYTGTLKEFLVDLANFKGPFSFDPKYRNAILNHLKWVYNEYQKNPEKEKGKGYELYFEMMGKIDQNWHNNFDVTGMANKLNDPTFSKTNKKDYYLANGEARVQAGGNISITGGYEGDVNHKVENSSEEIKIGDVTVDRTDAEFGVVIGDPNAVEQTENVKPVHKVEIQKGQVTINGVTINAATGGTLSSFAVAGTINPIIYIPIPQGNNGIFRPAVPVPGQRVPYKYETNIDFIDPNKYFGSDYFFEHSGLDRDKYGTVIGDAYYEKELINSTIKNALGYTGEVTGDNIKTMLDNAISVKDQLGLEVGKPLTPDQINNLEKDIVWYVEMEVDGDIVLVPQVYFGKETRLKMAEADKGAGNGSTVQAGGNIKVEGDDFVNNNGNIIAGGNVDINVKNDIINNSTGGFAGGIQAGGSANLEAGNDIIMSGGTVKADKDASLKAGNNINIESKIGLDEKGNQIITNTGGVQAGGNIDLSAGKDLNITGGVVESTNKGDVNLSGENVNIKDQNLISHESKSEGSGLNSSSQSKTESKSTASNVAGENVNIKSKNDTNIKGSNVVAGKDVNIEAGGNVNITDSQDVSHETSNSSKFGMGETGLVIGTSSSEKTTTKSKGSTVGGLGGVNIKSGGDLNLKGSDVISGEGGIDIETKGNVNITDGQDTVKGSSNSVGLDGLSFSKNDKEYKGTTSVGSGLSSMGNVNINAGGNVKSVGSDINSLGDTNITAKGDVKFEAGKNTYEEKSSSINVGVTKAGASAGVGGASAQATWSPTEGGSTSVTNGSAVEQSKDSLNMGNSKGGKNYMDSLASAHTEIGVSVKKSEQKSTTWTEGEVNTGGNLNIKSGGTVDIGGSDFTTGKDFNIEADKIDSTKFEDVHETKNDEFSLGVKVSNTTTSNIADTVNKGMQMEETLSSGKQLNEGLTAAQAAGSVSNMIFGDLAGNTTAVTGNLSVKKETSKTTTENTTNIKSGGDINFKTTGGDITLNGVEMKGDGISLDSAGNVNINSSKNTEESHSIGLDASVGVTGNVGVGVIDGAYAQVGVTGNAGFSKEDKNNQTHTGSTIDGNNITIKSKGDTNVKGSSVNGNDVKLDVGGNLNVETETDKIDESRIEAFAGLDVSGGGSSNTILTGDVGLSGGGGQIFKKGDKISSQGGINAKNSIDATVGGDLNLKGGVIGSETGNGKLDVKGNVNVEDVKSNYEEGGAIIGGNVGTKGFGIQGEVGDVVDKEVTSKGTIGVGNVTIGGDSTVNGNKNTGDNKLDGINKDMNNSLTVDKDITKGGGTFGITGSIPAGKGSSKKKAADNDGGNTPEFKIPRPDVVIPNESPNIPKVPEMKVPEPVKPEIPLGATPGNKTPDVVDGPETPKVPEMKVPEPVKPDTKAPEVNAPQVNKPDTGGYVKDPETGKWTKPNIDGGAILTGGAITNKNALDGFKNGLASLKGGSAKAETVPTPPTKAPVTEGQYVKNPETGKWEATGSTGKPGAITTQGPFGSKGSLDGFQKGAASLNKNQGGTTPAVPGGNNTGTAGSKTPVKQEGGSAKAETVPTPPTKAPVTEGQYVKNPETGKWEATGSTGKPGAITTQGPFGSKGSLDGFQKGAASLNKNQGGTTPAVPGGNNTGTAGSKTPVKQEGGSAKAETVPTPPTKAPVTEGQYVKNPETGKWEATGSTGKPGAITTQGPFGSKESLDGFQKGAASLNKNQGGTTTPAVGGTNPGTAGGKSPAVSGGTTPAVGGTNPGTAGGKSPAVSGGTTPGAAGSKTPVGNGSEVSGGSKVPSDSNGGYTKNPETGKWESNAGSGSSGKPGAITTQGPFGSKGSLDGFQKGAASLNKNQGGTTPAVGGTNPGTAGGKSPAVSGGTTPGAAGSKTPVGNGSEVSGGSKVPSDSNGGYTKNPETGKWESNAGSGSSGKPGAITTQGPFGSKGSLDGFQKGAASLNKNQGGTTPAVGGTNPGTAGGKSPAVSGGTTPGAAGSKTPVGNGSEVSGGSKVPSDSNGGYTKNPETGKWESNAGSGSSGKPGAITTQGPFGSKGSLDGFQKGAASLNKNQGGTTPAVGGTNPGTAGGKSPAVSGGTTPGAAGSKTPVGNGSEVSGGSKVPGDSNGGYTKNPETGKWESNAGSGSSGKPGAITTQGPFGSKGSLDGFQKGAASLNKNQGGTTPAVGGTNPGTAGGKSPAVSGGTTPGAAGSKTPVGNGSEVSGGSKVPSDSNGGYTKNPETGKWESNAGSGSSGKPGAITTQGPFGSKGSLDGFQKGAASLNKNQGGTTPGAAGSKTPVGNGSEVSGGSKVPGDSNGGYTKNPETGKWESTGSTGSQGVKTTNGPFGSKESLDGFQKGVASLNKNSGAETNKTQDKYDVLDKDNAFDFPKDDGTRVEINDTANEKKIIPETYIPLDAIPPKYNETGSIKKEQLESKVGDLLDKQKALADKGKLSRKDKAELDKIEKELESTLKELGKYTETPSGADGIVYPPADYDTADGVTYPPADYDTTDGDGMAYPPADYDAAPALPEVDYKPKKNVNFKEDVDVKYIDNDSTKPVEGGKESLKDED